MVEDGMESYCLSNSQGQKNKLEMLSVMWMHLQGLFDLENPSKVQHLQGPILIKFHLCFYSEAYLLCYHKFYIFHYAYWTVHHLDI